MSAEDIRANDAKIEDAAMLIRTPMENINVMTIQHVVPFLVVSNLVGTSVVILWRELQDWGFALRVEIDSPNGFEWFQWLAEQLEQYQPEGAKSAYEAFKIWAPIRLTHDT